MTHLIRFARQRPDGFNPGQSLFSWYAILRRDKGQHAALRRAASVTEALMVPMTHDLLARMSPVVDRTKWSARGACVAMLVADIKENSSTPFGGLCARKKPGGDRPVVSDESLRCMVSTNDPMSALRLLRSAVDRVGGSAPIIEMADIADAWPDQLERDLARRRILIAYYGGDAESTDA